MPISSLFLRSGPMAKFAVLSLMASGAVAQYSLSATYTGDSFFDNFDFFTGSDGGFVTYNDYTTAFNNGLVSTDFDGVSYLNVDTSNAFGGVAPDAVRIVSKAEFTHGLFIAVLNNMPGGYCGITSMFATQGPDAASGAIDIISGAGEQSSNEISLQSAGTCSSGNSQTISDPLSFGDNFNQNGGGVYATSWDSTAIKVWFWPAGIDPPADISSASPDPSTWGPPVADFEGCDVDTNFQNNKIVFDTNFCTDAAKAAFAGDSTCTAQADTCENFIANVPDAYDQAYWAIASISVYQLPAGATPPTTPTGPPAIAPVVGDYTYTGCVDEIDTRLFNGFHTAYDTMTLESCAADCAGFQYFGVEYGRECYCGNAPAVTPQVELDSACAMPCMGNTAEFCGDSMKLSLYELTADLPASPSSSVAAASSTVAPDAAASTTSSDSAVTTSDSAASSTTSDSAASSTTSDSAASSTTSDSAASSTSVDSAATNSDSAASSTTSDSAASSTNSDSAASSTTSGSAASSTAAPDAAVSTDSAASSTSSDSAASTTSDAAASSTDSASSSTTISPDASASGLDLGSSTTLSTSTLSSSAGVPSGMASDSSLPTYSAPSAASSSMITKGTPQASPSPSAPMTLSTVYTTKIYTITSCAATVTDCPARIGSVTTEIVSLYTTYCPGNATPSPSPTPATTPKPLISSSKEKVVVMMTTVVVTSYVDICPGNGELTTVVTSKTLTIPKPTGAGPVTEASIPMVTTTKTLTVSGSTYTATLTIPSGAAAPTYTPAVSIPASPASPANTGAAASPKVTPAGTSTVVVIPVQSAPAPAYPAGNSTVKAAGSTGLLPSTVKGVASASGSVAVPKQSAITAGAGTKEMSFGAGILALVGALVML